MTSTITTALHVLALTDKGAQVATNGSTDAPFWLPRDRYVAWLRPPAPGEFITAVLPQWLASKHKQLDDVVAYESVRDSNHNVKGTPNMAYEPKDLRGALFRNTEKTEGSNAPDYRGDLLINGIKFRLSGWLKDSTRGKFLSLAATREEAKSDRESPAKPKQAARGMADSEIPFEMEWRG